MRIGDLGEAELFVELEDSAKSLIPGGVNDLPDVFATSRMIALMEVAATKIMSDLLGAGQLSVGVGVTIKHIAPTPIGVVVKATARFLGMENQLYRFRVEAFDKSGLIGEGEHTRAIIHENWLGVIAAKRNSMAYTNPIKK